MFPGCPELKDGYYWASDRPGLGIDLDEKLAARFPIEDDPPFDLEWGNLRRRDGTSVKPYPVSPTTCSRATCGAVEKHTECSVR